MTEQTQAADDRPPTEDPTETDAPTEPDAPSADELLAEAQAERDQFRNMALRYRADLENYKKRAAQEMANVRDYANQQLLLKVADVADNFGRALDHLPPDADDGWIEGVRIAMGGMDEMLRSEGVERVPVAVGDPFDAHIHEALFTEPTDAVEEGSVARVFRNGYTLHSRLLRAAQVGVAQALPNQEQSQNQERDAEPNHGAASPRDSQETQ